MSEKKNKQEGKKENEKKFKRILDDFDLMIGFVKTDFNKMKDEELEGQVFNYSHFLIPEDSGSSFLNFAKAHERYSNMLNSEDGKKMAMTFFKAMQAGLKKKLMSLQSFIERSSSGELLTYEGEVKLIIDKENNRVAQIFSPKKIEYSGKLDLEKEYQLLNNKFFEVISYLIQELPLERLLLCPNSKCGLPFFQANQRKKYCSVKCSKAVAHVDYMKRKNKGGDRIKK